MREKSKAQKRRGYGNVTEDVKRKLMRKKEANLMRIHDFNKTRYMRGER